MLNVKFYILSLLWKQTSFIVEKCKCWSLFCESCSMFSFQGPTHCIYNIQTRGIEPRRLCSQLERLPRMRKVWRLNPSCDRPTSLKQVVTSPLLNARQQVRVSRVLPYHSTYEPSIQSLNCSPTPTICVCLFVLFLFFVQLENFSRIQKRHNEGLQIFTICSVHLAIEHQSSLVCHTYCDTGHPFIMVISENP